MPSFYALRKTLKTNTTYTMEKDRYYVIEKIGTDVAGKVTAKVDGIPVVDIHNLIAPLTKSRTNLYGPLNLDDLYIVVPPERQLYFDAPSSGNVEIYGKLVVLSPGETIPTDHLARYNSYDKRKLSYIDVSVTVGTSWAADAEVKVADITPPTIEDWEFSKRVGVSVSGLSAALTYGQVGIKFLYDGKPLDLLLTVAGPHGIDAMQLQLPPTSDTNYEPFSFSEMPVLVAGGHTLSVIARNISGSALSAASGSNIAVRFMAVYKRNIKA